MTISGFDVVFFTLLLVVPGYLAIEVRKLFQARKPLGKEQLTLQIMVFGSLSFFSGIWWFNRDEGNPLKDRLKAFDFTSAWDLVAWFVVLFVVPPFIGYCSHLLQVVLDKVSRSKSDPTAWDLMTKNLGGTVGVQVKTKIDNEDMIYGEFGEKSYAAFQQDGGDLYLQFQQRKRSENLEDGFCNLHPSRGVWIPANEILRVVHFYEPLKDEDKKVNNNQQKEKLCQKIKKMKNRV